MAKAKTIDTLPKFEDWLDSQFDAVQAGDADNATILREASLLALRIGAGDIVGQVADKPTQTETLAAIGRLLAWCRSQPDSRLLWDAGEAAAMLGLSERTLWSLRKSSKVPSLKIGNLVRYSPAALREWIAEANGLAV